MECKIGDGEMTKKLRTLVDIAELGFDSHQNGDF